MGVNQWCMLRSSGKVKSAVKYVMNRDNLTCKELGKIAGVRPSRVSEYINHTHQGGRPSITQFQLMKICQEIGVDVKLDVNF